MKISHFFLPHPQTHKKAHLISWQAILVYIGIFILLQFSFNFIKTVKPGVLGVSSGVDHSEVIRLTNEERVKNGLSPLTENPKLSDAARRKAANMFEENYWAHYSPSGKDPWGFIQAAGYRFSFAGENLAKNFYNSQDVVNAWMASPSHKENILNPKYQEIGLAVVPGTLLGQETTLVVQEFGTPVEAVAAKPPTQVQGEQIKAEASLEPTPVPTLLAQAPEAQTVVSGVETTQTTPVLIDSFFVTRTLGISLFSLIAILILIDIYILRRRAVLRISSRHLPHLALLAVGISVLINVSPGQIL